MVEKLNAMKMGDPLDPATQLGPVVSESHMRTVLDYIEIGKKEGARLLCGGARATDGALANGYFVRPTLFADVTNDMRIAREEIFGPVLAVLKYDTVDDAVRMANDSIYGLSAGVWSKDVDAARKVAARLRSGTIWINEWHMLSERSPKAGAALHSASPNPCTVPTRPTWRRARCATATSGSSTVRKHGTPVSIGRSTT
jgi:aldehyde dehydrogenase (NAD+)